jgi:hypothetical protein
MTVTTSHPAVIMMMEAAMMAADKHKKADVYSARRNNKASQVASPTMGPFFLKPTLLRDREGVILSISVWMRLIREPNKNSTNVRVFTHSCRSE